MSVVRPNAWRPSGQEVVDLLGTLHPIRRQRWELAEEREQLEEKLTRYIGKSAVLGKVFRQSRLSNHAKMLMRRSGVVQAHSCYLDSLYDITLDHIEARLRRSLIPESQEPATLTVIPYEDVPSDKTFGGYSVKIPETVIGRFDGLNGSGDIWIDHVNGSSYQVRPFDRELRQQVDIEVTYPGQA